MIPRLLLALVPAVSLLAQDAAPTAPERVGPDAKLGQSRVVTPDNSILSPAGRQIDLPKMRPQAAALSPDGQLLAVSGKASVLVIINPADGTIRQSVALPSEDDTQPAIEPRLLNPDKSGQLSFTGLIFSPDGRRIYLSNVNGSIKVFNVAPDSTVSPSHSIPLPIVNAEGRSREIPAGLALNPDGSRLFVALNLSNKVAEIDTASGKILRSWPVGIAPFDVVWSPTKLYVSNWGGRRPDASSPTAHAGRGNMVRVDPRTGAASEGSLSIIDLSSDSKISELVTGRHASGLALSPDGRWLCVACAADDFIAVLDTNSSTFTGRIFPKHTPADLFGAAPNALTFSRDGRTLWVCNGTQNAIAEIEFTDGKGELESLIPTGWYPGTICIDHSRSQLCIGNIKGIGSRKDGAPGTSGSGFNSHQYFGTVSLIPIPATKDARKAHTDAVLANYRAPKILEAFAPPRPNLTPVPIPERTGEPSVFKHVLYIIKENRTYDQVLGDIKEGSGDPALTIFGEPVTPAQHRIARDFALLDNTYCSGILSADGHNWSCSAITTDYMERQFAGFPRSYPDGFGRNGSDALAWSPNGFIWDAALARKLTVRLYGEFADSVKRWRDGRRGSPSWKEVWADWQLHRGSKDSAIELRAIPSIDTIVPHFDTDFPTYDNGIPDRIRADVFIRQLELAEKENRDLPALMVMSLPGDHTSGAQAGSPTPRAHVADHDQAFGRIVDALSHSRFWKDTCILAIEDDPQNGWDHISGYRTTAFVASAWSRNRGTISTNYNQTSILRTIGLILGLPPMNQLDASATPMRDCFGPTPDFTPWSCPPAQWNLDELNPSTASISHPALRRDAEISASLPLHKLDACPEDVLNQILWRSVHPDAPYPAWAISETEDDD